MRRVFVALLIIAAGGGAVAQDKREAGLAAWQKMESVLTHPRCLNCHTMTDYPRQGDDRHPHRHNVLRGFDGHGVPAAKCSTCHHAANATVAGVPGRKNWGLAPLSMAWERRPGEAMDGALLCRTLKDPKKNHGLSLAKLVEHHDTEPLVLWAWSPGNRPDGSPRAVPPIPHAEFVAATKAWAAAGGPCPAP